MWGVIASGGFVMYPLLICSLVGWGIIFERLWQYHRLRSTLRSFHLEAVNVMLRSDLDALRGLCHQNNEVPTARLLMLALERLGSRDERLRSKWQEAIERGRLLVNQDLRKNLWILGTIASSAPFIGLFGTVIGILRSFHSMAEKGSGGFTVVAAGISESLIATAAGIIVAVVAVLAFNAFQTKWSHLVLLIRVHTEEFAEILSSILPDTPSVPERKSP